MKYYFSFMQLCCLFLCMGNALAAPDTTSGKYTIRAEVLTDFPLQVGAGAMVELQNRIRLRSSIGFLPEPYLNTINTVAEAAEWYDEKTSALISAALNNSLLWRTRVGWRPWAKRGFYFDGGYTLTTLGGGLSGADVLTSVLDDSYEISAPNERSFDIGASVHFIDTEIGWEWAVRDKIWLRAALGGAFTVAASTEIEPSWTPAPIAQGPIEIISVAGEEYLNDIFTQYVHTATLSLALGWSF